MGMRCFACGSGHTEALGGEYCCLDCGAQTSFDGAIVRAAKTEQEKGGPFGEPVDAAAGRSADFYANRTSDWIGWAEPEKKAPEKATSNKGK